MASEVYFLSAKLHQEVTINENALLREVYHSPKQLSDYFLAKGIYHINDTAAIGYFLKSAHYANLCADTSNLFWCYNNIGGYYYSKSKPSLAYMYFDKAIQLSDSDSLKKYLVANHLVVSSNTLRNGEYNQELKEYLRYSDFNSQTHLSLSFALFKSFIASKNLAEADSILASFQNRKTPLDQEFLMELTWLEGWLDLEKGYTDIAIPLFKEALSNFGDFQLKETVSKVHLLLSEAYVTNGQLSLAKRHADSALTIAKEHDLLERQAGSLLLLADIAKTNNNFKDAFEYQKQAYTINDSLNRTEFTAQTAEYIQLLEVERREQQISLLEKQKELESTKAQAMEEKAEFNLHLSISIALGSLIAIALIILFWRFRYTRKKESMARLLNIIQTNKSNTLEEAILSQKKERDRIAMELHDSLGAILSTVKMYFERAVSTNVNPETKLDYYQKGNDLLNKSIERIRDFSHNLHSMRLIKEGLEQTILTMIETTTKESNIEVEFEYFNKTVEPHFLLAYQIYLWTQELIYNMLKHSNGTEAWLEIAINEDTAQLLFKENSTAMTQSKLDKVLSEHKGLGLSGMINTVEQMEGSIEFTFEEGYSVFICTPSSQKSLLAKHVY